MKKKEELKIDKAIEIKAKEAMERKDYNQAKKLLEDLEKQGSLNAKCNLAIMFLNGHGVPASPEKAEELFSQASERGCIEADYYLGVMYAEGIIAKDIIFAMKYLTQAATQGHKGAQFRLGMVFASTTNRAIQSDLKARDYLLEAAAEPEGLASAQYALGKAYKEGHLKLDTDPGKAREYFLSAAKKEYKEAQYCLGLMSIEGQGGEKNEVEGLEWLAKAARQGHQDAIYYLKAYANICGIGAEDTSKQVPKLIEAAKQFLGEDYSEDLENMFSELWHGGIPILRREPFYHYKYKLYPSRQSLPSSKQERTVYLYVENGILHYQLLKQLELCQGTLNVPSGFNLDWLKEISFTKTPPSPENIRQIYYRCSSTQTNCIYEVIDDKGEVCVGAVSLAPGEDIEQKLLNIVKNNHCKEYLESLQQSLQKQLIENGHIEPSYEDKFREKILKKYGEIRGQEKNLFEFLRNFIVVLENPKFKEVFSSSEAFEALVLQYLPAIKELKSKQQDIKRSLKENPATSKEIIDDLKVAYKEKIDFEKYHKMVNFIQSLDKLINDEKDPEAIKEKIENICEKCHAPISMELLNLPAIFIAQFMTRRIYLLNELAKFFSKGHDKFHELDSIFFLFNKLVTIINRALPPSWEVEQKPKNLDVRGSIQSKLAKEEIKLKAMCFDLIKPIFTMLMLEVEQLDKDLILNQYHAQKKELVDRLGTLAEWFQSEAPKHTSIVSEIREIIEVIQKANNLASIIEHIAGLINSIHVLLPQMDLNEINNLTDFFESDQEKLFFNPFLSSQTKERLLSPQTKERLLSPQIKERLLSTQSKERLPSPQTKERVLSPQTKERLLSPQTKERVISSPTKERVLSPQTTERRASGVNSILSLSLSLSLPLANLLTRESRMLDRTKSSPHHNSDPRSSLRENGEDSNTKRSRPPRQKSDMSSLNQDVMGPNSSPKMAPNSSPKKMRAVQSESYNGDAHPLVDDFSRQQKKGYSKLSESCSISKPSLHHDSDRRSSLRENGEDSNTKRPRPRQKSDMSSLKQDLMGPNSSPKKMRAVQSESYNGGAHPLVDDFSRQKNIHRNKLSDSASLNPAGAWQKVTVDSCDSIGRSKRSHSPGLGQISLGNRNVFLSRPISRPNALSVEDRSNEGRRAKENGDRVKEEGTKRNVSFNFFEFLSPRQQPSGDRECNLPKLDLDLK